MPIRLLRQMVEKFASDFYRTCIHPFGTEATADAHFPKVYRRVFSVRTHIQIDGRGERGRTSDFFVPSETRYHCATPR